MKKVIGQTDHITQEHMEGKAGFEFVPESPYEQAQDYENIEIIYQKFAHKYEKTLNKLAL